MHTLYRKVGQRDTPPENFELPFNGQLSPENPWVVMASLIPWEKYEDVYAKFILCGKKSITWDNYNESGDLKAHIE